MKDV
jgi:hypothetical protein